MLGRTLRSRLLDGEQYAPLAAREASSGFPAHSATVPDTNGFIWRWAKEGPVWEFCKRFVNPQKLEALSIDTFRQTACAPSRELREASYLSVCHSNQVLFGVFGFFLNNKHGQLFWDRGERDRDKGWPRSASAEQRLQHNRSITAAQPAARGSVPLGQPLTRSAAPAASAFASPACGSAPRSGRRGCSMKPWRRDFSLLVPSLLSVVPFSPVRASPRQVARTGTE